MDHLNKNIERFKLHNEQKSISFVSKNFDVSFGTRTCYITFCGNSVPQEVTENY